MKRVIDVSVSVLLLVSLAPVMLAVALALLACHGWPILYAQQRPGFRGRPFILRKFRTMWLTEDANGRLLPDAERVTRLGRFLRAASLDELPTLWNVVTGDMSLVGPRPLLMEYLPLYTTDQSRRHEVRPGITGWAQVNGRNAISWEQKFAYDLWYIDHWSFGLDLKILAMTLVNVLRAEGISQEGQATVERFRGGPA